MLLLMVMKMMMIVMMMMKIMMMMMMMMMKPSELLIHLGGLQLGAGGLPGLIPFPPLGDIFCLDFGLGWLGMLPL